MGLQDARFLYIFNSGYKKLWEINDWPIATLITSVHNAQPLSPDFLVVIRYEANMGRQISAVYELYDIHNIHTSDFSRWWLLLLNQDIELLEKTCLS